MTIVKGLTVEEIRERLDCGEEFDNPSILRIAAQYLGDHPKDTTAEGLIREKTAARLLEISDIMEELNL